MVGVFRVSNSYMDMLGNLPNEDKHEVQRLAAFRQ